MKLISCWECSTVVTPACPNPLKPPRQNAGRFLIAAAEINAPAGSRALLARCCPVHAQHSFCFGGQLIHMTPLRCFSYLSPPSLFLFFFFFWKSHPPFPSSRNCFGKCIICSVWMSFHEPKGNTRCASTNIHSALRALFRGSSALWYHATPCALGLMLRLQSH